MEPRIRVTHEWAKLREVIVGRARYRILKPFPDQLRAGMGAAEWEQVKAQEGRLLADAFPVLQARAQLQMACAADLLRERGVVVHEVPEFEASEEFGGEPVPASRGHGSIQCFPRDPLLAAGDRLLELTLRDPLRRRELLPLRRLVAGLPSALPAASMGGADSPHQPRACVEGGDCLVNGREVYAGLSGRATNRWGVRWLRAALGEGWTVTPIRLAKAFPHLDMALALVRPGLGVRCPAAFPEGMPPSLADWDWVEVTPEQALRQLAANVLPLDAGTTLVAAEVPALAEELSRRGQTVLATPFGGVAWLRGGLRCWTQPLVRED